MATIDPADRTPQVPQGYTPKEAAAIIGSGFTGKKVRRLIRKSTITATKFLGRHYILPADLAKFQATVPAAAAEAAVTEATTEATS